MRFLVLALLVGCSANATAPDIGTDAREAALPDAGGPNDAGGDVTPVPACNAPLTSLHGQAVYVVGSAVAADPTMQVTADGQTCAEWVPAHMQDIDAAASGNTYTVLAGQIGTAPTTMVGATAVGSGCIYRLRTTTIGVPSTSSPCQLTRDFDLSVP